MTLFCRIKNPMKNLLHLVKVWVDFFRNCPSIYVCHQPRMGSVLGHVAVVRYGNYGEYNPNT